MLRIALTAVAGYSAIAKLSHRNHDSEPPPYSFLTHVSQFLPYAAMLFFCAVGLHEKGTPFLPGVLKKFGTVFGLLFIPPLVSIGIMFLTIKKLHLEPYKTIWHLSTAVVPRILVHLFLWLLSLEGLSLLSRPSGPCRI
jgi:hypothetical protein